MASEHPAAFVWSGNAQLRSPLIWIGTTTTNGGAWSVDFTQAGFVSAPVVTATAQLSSANVYDRAVADLSTAPTTTGAAGYAIRGSNMLVLGSSVRTVPDGTVIQVTAIGETFTS